MERQNISSNYPFEDAYGYSRAVRVGNQVFVSGTTARAPHLDGDAYVQAKAALALIADVLAEAGAGLQDVVRTVVYVIDMADTQRVGTPKSSIASARRARWSRSAPSRRPPRGSRSR